jgi:hypothetical protein
VKRGQGSQLSIIGRARGDGHVKRNHADRGVVAGK